VALRGEDAQAAGAAADVQLTAIEPDSGDVLVVRAQIRQMLDDLQHAADDSATADRSKAR
jgi:hypothetical protein